MTTAKSPVARTFLSNPSMSALQPEAGLTITVGEFIYTNIKEAMYWAAYEEKPLAKKASSRLAKGAALLGDAAAEQAYFEMVSMAPTLRRNWTRAKQADAMRDVMRISAQTHAVVRKALRASGLTSLVHDDNAERFWGTGPTNRGQNLVGLLWMQVRAELATGVLKATRKKKQTHKK